MVLILNVPVVVDVGLNAALHPLIVATRSVLAVLSSSLTYHDGDVTERQSGSVLRN